jgi:hypothetical protein
MSIRSAVRRTLVLTLLASVAGCTDATTAIESGSGITRVEPSGLEHRVTLTPSEPTAGGDVQIHSVITNRGTESVALNSRICGLDYGGNLKLAYPNGSAACGGYSMGGSIAPGESRTNTDLNRVASALGVYTLRVRHALRPELWVEMRVVVRAR